MTFLALFVMATIVVIGLLLLVSGFSGSAERTDDDLAEYLRSLEESGEPVLDDYQQKLQEPMISRILRPLGTAAASSISSVTPRAQLDRIHAQLLQAGLAGSIRAEELAALQVVLTGAALLVGVFLTGVSSPSLSMAVVLLVLFPGAALLLPQAWLTRKADERAQEMRNDLPDALDLMAIAVEAGTGFEGAIAVVCSNFKTPLGFELSRLLREMELGLSRREALQNLKRRTGVAEISGFVQALVQADALGMPVGRVLKTQAVEMRNKRRAWAREKAGKLPVKIMIPLVLFIFPSIFVITLGPAVSSITASFG
jgi:tight adherence protein C